MKELNKPFIAKHIKDNAERYGLTPDYKWFCSTVHINPMIDMDGNETKETYITVVPANGCLRFINVSDIEDDIYLSTCKDVEIEES